MSYSRPAPRLSNVDLLPRLACLIVAVGLLSFAGCRQVAVPASDAALREELESVNGQLRKLSATRQQVAREVIGLQSELADLDELLQQLEEDEVELQYRLNLLLGKRPPTRVQGRALEVFWQWGLAILAFVVCIILVKIRRSRLRDATRLAEMKRVLARPSEPEGDSAASANED